MTGLQGLWPTWAIPSVTRPWEISSSVMGFRQLPRARRRPLGTNLSVLTWPCWWRRFLHDRGVALVQDGAVRDVLGSLRRSVDDASRTYDGLTLGAIDTPDLSVVVRLAYAPSTHDRRGSGARMGRVHVV